MTQAEKIAEQLGMDGQVWATKDGQSLDDLCEAARGTKSYQRGWGIDGNYTGHTSSYKYTFFDGSVITCHGAAWDLGYADCWCWAGYGHDESCRELANYECSERLARWVIEQRCYLDTAQGDSDRSIAVGLGNGSIQIPEWMGVREECDAALVWDKDESDGDTHLVWLGADDEQ
jgi:hypothetical protein